MLLLLLTSIYCGYC